MMQRISISMEINEYANGKFGVARSSYIHNTGYEYTYVKFSVHTRNKYYDTFHLEYINIVLFFFFIPTFPGYLLLSHVLQAAVGRGRCAQQSPLPAWRSNSRGTTTATKTTPHTPLTCKVREQRQKVARTSMKSKQRHSFA